MKDLAGKVALITGASSGIGHATAELFAGEGASVVVTARREEKLDALVTKIQQAGGKAIRLVGDVQDEAHAKSAVDLALSEFGRLDIAFNNAGMLGESRSTTEMSEEDWSQVLRTNLTSGFLGVKHQAPALLESGGGSIIFTSSFVGHTVGFPGMAAYAASKSGLIGLMQVVAAELGPKGIRVNALLPGGTDTDMNIANAPDAGPEVREFLNGLHALNRLASPEEIAQAALFLASDSSSFVTGTSMLVDGGVSMTKG